MAIGAVGASGISENSEFSWFRRPPPLLPA